MLPFPILVVSSFLFEAPPTPEALLPLPPDSSTAASRSDSLDDGWEYFPDEPRVVYQPQPTWPREAKCSKRQVKVWCKVEIDTLGKPLKVFLLKSQDNAFNKHALHLARQYRFTPRGFTGEKKRVWIAIPILFQNPDSSGR